MLEKELNQASVNDYRFKFVAISGNAKTGKLSQTYTAVKNDHCGSCPVTNCIFRKSKVCYAECGFHTRIHWNNTAKSETNIFELEKQIAVAKKKTDTIRHNIAGDLAITGTNEINKTLLEKLTAIYKKYFKIAYSYTHCSVNDRNIDLVKNAMQDNFVINFSTESIETAKKCINSGVNAVIAVNTMSKPVVKINNVTVVQCPQSLNKDHKCQNCGLCWQKNRKIVVAFPVHGSGQSKSKKTGMLIDL